MIIALGSDHAAYDFKQEIMRFLDEKGVKYKDFGCFNRERTDYPKYALAVSEAVSRGEYEKGMLFCGTGVGMAITANKVKGIRAVVCSDCYSARMSRQHNNANVLSLGARVVGIELAKLIISEWLNAEYEADRHEKRLKMIRKIEES